METTAAGTRIPLSETHLRTRKEERPDPAWVRGECPCCGSDVVSNAWYIGGRGYVIIWHCWEALGDEPTCDYKRVL